MNRLEKALVEAAAALGAAGYGFALVGGLAVSARSEPRFTRDADLAVAVSSDREAEALVARLISRGYRLLAQVEQSETGRLATVRLAPPGEDTPGLVVDLLFASSGIESEIVRDAQLLRISAEVSIPVASIEHLLALKVLSMDDRSRPQDRADFLALRAEATSGQLSGCRASLELIEQRGYARGKALGRELDKLLAVDETR